MFLIFSILSCTILTVNGQFNNSTSTLNDSQTVEISAADSLRLTIINTVICIICILMIIVTIVGNALVVLAVTIVRKLHTEDNANNYLLVSLAISDFLVGVLVMPFALHVEVVEGNKWALSAILCDMWTLFDVLLCTASILNLVAISIDRYFIILHAMVYTQRRNAKLMMGMIVSVWLLSALISIPPLFGWGRASVNLEQLGICLVSQDFRYQIYATLLAFYIPLLVMIIIYINIYRAARKIKKKEMETCGRLQKQDPYPVMYTSVPQQQQQTTHLSVGSSFKLNSKKPNKSNSIISNTSTHHHQLAPHLSSSTSLKVTIRERFSRRLTNVFAHIKRNSSLTAAQGKNQKATRTLGIIMGCFILCWLPFFILAIVKPIPLSNGKTVRDYIPTWLDSFLLWLGYFNSALNPIIYARFNTEFRRPFIEILLCRCRGINEKLRNYERRKMYMDANLFSPTINVQRSSECSIMGVISSTEVSGAGPCPSSGQIKEQQKIEIIQTPGDEQPPPLPPHQRTRTPTESQTGSLVSTRFYQTSTTPTQASELETTSFIFNLNLDRNFTSTSLQSSPVHTQPFVAPHATTVVQNGSLNEEDEMKIVLIQKIRNNSMKSIRRQDFYQRHAVMRKAHTNPKLPINGESVEQQGLLLKPQSKSEQQNRHSSIT